MNFNKIGRLLVCLVLICCILVHHSPIQAEAMSGSGIIGAGAAGVGLTLTAGQVAILLLGAFGVYYVARHADELGRSLENALSSAASSDELASWWETAKTGAIDLLSAPAGIASAIKDWASDFITGSASISSSYSPEYCAGAFLPANTKISVAPGVSATFSQDGYICLTYLYSPTVSWYRYLGFVFSVAEGSRIDYVVGGNSGSTSAGYCHGNWQVSATPDDYALAGRAIYETSDITSANRQIVNLLSNGEAIPYYTPLVDVYPDVIAGGIKTQLDAGFTMDVIGLPDIVIPGADVFPVNPDEDQTQADAITDYLIQALINGDITWEEYWKLIGVYNPDIGTSSPTIDKVNEGTGEVTKEEIGTGEVVVPAVIGDYTMDLTKFFPFCIPFDLYDFATCLLAEPEAPVIEWIVPTYRGEPCREH